jgi:hypothetical protein
MRLCITVFLVAGCLCLAADVALPQRDAVTLTPVSMFDFDQINESSALVKSRLWDDVYWTLNDSGDWARIFPVNHQGQVIRPEWNSDYQGVRIPNAVNVDWEEMATDNQGNLIIGACGNNGNARRDLALYILPDPLPQLTETTRASRMIRFYYPQQTSFPADPNNFDCEAVFCAFDNIYLLTKHRADTRTCLYRFDSLDPGKSNPVTLLDSFDAGGMVTAADATPDGTRLAVLTYNSVWLFESETDDYFNGAIYWLPISAKQCEAICFDGDILRITNEQMELFELPISELEKVK